MTTPIAATSGAWRATSRSRKPSPRTTPITSGVFSARARLEVVVLRRRAADQPAPGSSPRSRSIVSPTAASEGSAAGIAWIRLDPAGARRRRQDRGDPGIAARDRRRPRSAIGSTGATICSAPGAPGPKAPATASYPWREESSSGTTLIEGIPVSRLSTGNGERNERHKRRQLRSEAVGAKGARPRRRNGGSGARRSAPRAARAGRPAARAWRAPPEAGSASPRARRGRRA